MSDNARCVRLCDEPQRHSLCIVDSPIRHTQNELDVRLCHTTSEPLSNAFIVHLQAVCFGPLRGLRFSHDIRGSADCFNAKEQLDGPLESFAAKRIPNTVVRRGLLHDIRVRQSLDWDIRRGRDDILVGDDDLPRIQLQKLFLTWILGHWLVVAGILARFLCGDARDIRELASSTVDLLARDWVSGDTGVQPKIRAQHLRQNAFPPRFVEDGVSGGNAAHPYLEECNSLSGLRVLPNSRGDWRLADQHSVSFRAITQGSNRRHERVITNRPGRHAHLGSQDNVPHEGQFERMNALGLVVVCRLNQRPLRRSESRRSYHNATPPS